MPVAGRGADGREVALPDVVDGERVPDRVVGVVDAEAAQPVHGAQHEVPPVRLRPAAQLRLAARQVVELDAGEHRQPRVAPRPAAPRGTAATSSAAASLPPLLVEQVARRGEAVQVLGHADLVEAALPRLLDVAAPRARARAPRRRGRPRRRPGACGSRRARLPLAGRSASSRSARRRSSRVVTLRFARVALDARPRGRRRARPARRSRWPRRGRRPPARSPRRSRADREALRRLHGARARCGRPSPPPARRRRA